MDATVLFPPIFHYVAALERWSIMHACNSNTTAAIYIEHKPTQPWLFLSTVFCVYVSVILMFSRMQHILACSYHQQNHIHQSVVMTENSAFCCIFTCSHQICFNVDDSGLWQ